MKRTATQDSDTVAEKQSASGVSIISAHDEKNIFTVATDATVRA